MLPFHQQNREETKTVKHRFRGATGHCDVESDAGETRYVRQPNPIEVTESLFGGSDLHYQIFRSVRSVEGIQRLRSNLSADLENARGGKVWYAVGCGHHERAVVRLIARSGASTLRRQIVDEDTTFHGLLVLIKQNKVIYVISDFARKS